MNILKLIAERDKLVLIAVQNRMQITKNLEAQPAEVRVGNEMLMHHYNAFIKACTDKTNLLAVCEIARRQAFTSYASINTQIQPWVDHLVKRHAVSDEYIIALGMFRATLKNYLALLDQFENQLGCTLLDNIDLLRDYVQKLQKANFSPRVIIEACQKARDTTCTLGVPFEIPDTKSLFHLHDSFIEFVSYSSQTTDEEKCENLTTFFNRHFSLTTMIDHIERQCRQLNADTRSWCILWNASSFKGASRTSTNEPEHTFHEFNY